MLELRMLREWTGVAILGFAGLVAIIDQQLLGLLIEPIKHDLRVTDSQIGFLHGPAVAFFFAMAAFPVGWLADRFDRRIVLAGCVLVWSGATAFCGFATTFPALLVGAIGLAIGESALIPIIYAATPQVVSDVNRPSANVFIYAVLALSGGVALLIGGQALGLVERLEIGGSLQPWRVLFVSAGALGLPLMLLLTLIRFKAVPPLQARASRTRDGYVRYLRSNGWTLFGVFFALGIYSCAWLALFLWSPPILSRVFDYPPGQAGTEVGLVVTAATVVGIAVGAFLTTGLRMPSLRLARLGCLISGIAMGAMPFANSPDILLTFVGIGACGMVAASSIAPTLLQDAAPQAFRSRTIALFPLVVLSIRVTMPVGIGMLSDAGGATGTSLLNAVSLLCALSMPVSIALMYWVEPSFERLAAANRLVDNPSLGRDTSIAWA